MDNKNLVELVTRKIDSEIYKYDIKDPMFYTIKAEFLGLVKQNLNGYVFSLKTICDWVEMNDLYEQFIEDEDFRKDFYKEKLADLIYNHRDDEDEGDYTIDKINGISMPFFSTEGFKAFCIIQSTDKAILVQHYFIHIEACYHTVLQQSDEETKLELAELNREITKLESSSFILRWSNERDFFKKQNTDVKAALKRLVKLDSVMRDGCTDDEYKLSKYIEKKYCKTVVPLYVVNYDFIVESDKSKLEKFGKSKKSNNDKDDIFDTINNDNNTDIEYNTSENTNCEYQMDYNEYNINSFGNNGVHAESLLFYHIGPITKTKTSDEKYHKITDLYYNKNDFVKVKQVLDERIGYKQYAYKTNHKSIYFISFARLDEIKNDIMQAYLYEEFSDIKDLDLKPIEDPIF
jgi:hypothetical protein